MPKFNFKNNVRVATRGHHAPSILFAPVRLQGAIFSSFRKANGWRCFNSDRLDAKRHAHDSLQMPRKAATFRSLVGSSTVNRRPTRPAPRCLALALVALAAAGCPRRVRRTRTAVRQPRHQASGKAVRSNTYTSGFRQVRVRWTATWTTASLRRSSPVIPSRTVRAPW